MSSPAENSTENPISAKHHLRRASDNPGFYKSEFRIKEGVKNARKTSDVLELCKIHEGATNYENKVKLIKSTLDDIKTRTQKHYTLFRKYKNLKTLSTIFINALNAVSVCSMVLTYTPINSVVKIIALTTTSTSAITSAVHNSLDVEGKVHNHMTSYLQYIDVYRDIRARLLKNGLSSQELDSLLVELNSRVGLIEDHSLPIDFFVFKSQTSVV